MTETPTPALAVGDVIQDVYGNPAVVVRVEMAGTRFERYTIMQTAGSDRGHVTSAPTRLVPITDQARVEWARDVVRAEARRQRYRWDRYGITR